MAWWTTQFNELARTAAQDPILVEESDSLYVDDYNFVFHILPSGMRWKDDEKKMEIEQNLIEQDMTMADDVRSMKEIIKMANSICPTLQFTGDCPGANTNNKLPILDVNCWVEDNCVLYEHYTKPMASSLVIPQRSAVSQKVKRATIAQMAVKILENTSLELPWSRKAQLLSNLSLRIKQSGYNASFRLNIFKSALKCWERRLQMDQSGDRPLHRERNWK